MRRADSLLIALTDEEIEAGLTALRAEGDSIEGTALHVAVFET
jgi:hypothetical protein